MINQAKLKLERNRRLSEIKNDVMQIVSFSNALKQKLNHQKIHYLELGGIIERGINIFLHISQSEMSEENEAVGVLDDFLQLKEMLGRIVNYCEYGSGTSSLNVNLDLVCDKIYVTVDHKYFTKALEYIIKKFFLVTQSCDLLSIEAEKNYNQTLLLKFSYNNSDLDSELNNLSEVCRSEFVKEVMNLHGVDLNVRQLSDRNALVMRIPAYRLYYQD